MSDFHPRPLQPSPGPPLAPPDDVPRFLSQEACAAILKQLQAFGWPSSAPVSINSWWQGKVRWARNRITAAGDWRTNSVHLPNLDMNQVDAASLRAAVDSLGLHAEHKESAAWSETLSYPQTPIWSEASYTQMPEARTALVTQAMATAEQAGVLSAGYLDIEAHGAFFRGTNGVVLYAPQTLAQCSITVRDPKTQASGWAGASSYDWTRIDVAKMAAVALDKCLKSRNPLKVEPGRYTAILEPQAVYGLISQLFDRFNMDMFRNEQDGSSTFTDKPLRSFFYPRGALESPLQYSRTRIGQQVIDARLTLRSDPLDPELGTLPFSSDGDPFVPVTWIERGVLKTLAMPGLYAIFSRYQQAQPWPITVFHEQSSTASIDSRESSAGASGAFRLESSAPPVTVEEMVATTKRGLLVTRFWQIHSSLSTGVTRDGLWLIENGKISHPVQNFRFTESPLFALNNVEQIGTSVPIFSPECPAVCPALKVRDFNFSALIDAV